MNKYIVTILLILLTGFSYAYNAKYDTLKTSTTKSLYVESSTFSANTAKINKLYNSVNTSVRWTMSSIELADGVGPNSSIAITLGSMNFTSNLNGNGKQINLANSTFTCYRLFIPIKQPTYLYQSSLSITSAKIAFLWSGGSAANDTTLCSCTAVIGIGRWKQVDDGVWNITGSTYTTIFTPLANSRVITLDFPYTVKIPNDDSIYFMYMDAVFFRNNAGVAPSGNSYIFLNRVNLWGKYDE